MKVNNQPKAKEINKGSGDAKKGLSNSQRAPQKEKPFGEEIIKDEKYAEDIIISKLMKKGFESLSIEELAVTIISPTFENDYLTKTGQEWSKENKAKAIERLNFAKFNIQWNTTISKKVATNGPGLTTPFGVLFELCERGDIQRVIEFLKKNARYNEEILCSVDKNKKSPLHIAAKCGHTSLVTVLISRGFSVHLRDKFLRTPLHIACQFGRGTVVDELLKAGSDIYARDSIGRTCLHYAACSDSIELVTLLLGTDPDMVFSRDTYGRTPLHYAVWNNSYNQADITRKILDAKSEVDCLDEEQMTPLHYAADAGKANVIALLLKYGANPYLRDGRTHRTALELALTEHIREMIIVYSGKPYSVPKEDMDKLKLEGEKVDLGDVKTQEENEMLNKRGTQKSKSQPKKKNLAQIQEMRESTDAIGIVDKNINEMLFKSQKEKLISHLKNIQEYGVKSMQHLSKPAMYSGSWLENIKNIEDLHLYLNSLTPTEAVIRVFNLISPYQNSFPQGKGEETDMAFFFNTGDKVSSEGGDSNANAKVNLHLNHTKSVNEASMKNVMDIEIQNKQLEEQKAEIGALKDQIKTISIKLEQSEKNTENSKYVLELKQQIAKYETENNRLKLQSERLVDQLKLLTDSINSYENAIQASKKKEQDNNKLIEKLISQINDMKNEFTLIQDAEKKKLQFSISENLQNQKNMSNNLILGKDSRELTLNEEKSIYVFLKILETKKINLDQLLIKCDKDNDLHILKNEFVTLLEDLNLQMDDRIPVIKLAGFSKKNKLSINSILDNIYKREERKYTKLNEILFQIAYDIHNNLIDIETVYESLKSFSDSKGLLTYQGLQEGISKAGISTKDMSIDLDMLFRCLSITESNKIAIDEVIDKLKVRKIIVDEIGDLDHRIRYEIKAEKEEEEEEGNVKERKNKAVAGNDEDIQNEDEMKMKMKMNNATDNNNEEDLIHEDNNDESLRSEPMPELIDNINTTTKKNPTENAKIIPKGKTDNSMQQRVTTTFPSNVTNISNPGANESISSGAGGKNKIQNANNKPFNRNQKILGELKIQVKQVENIIIPNVIPKPYALSLTFSLQGIETEFDSKEVISDDPRLVNFNWASRILLKNKTIDELGAQFNLALKVKNGKIPIILGDCKITWTNCLQERNWDKFVVADEYQFLSKRKNTVGVIKVQAKFIPMGSENSLFDASGKKKKIPNSFKGMVKEPEILKEKDEEQVAQSEDGEKKKEEERQAEPVREKEIEKNERVEEENATHPSRGNTTIKTITAELINIFDTHLLKDPGLYLTFESGLSEIFTTKDKYQFGDILSNFPFEFTFSIYSYDKEDSLKLIMYLKDTEEMVIGHANFEFNSKEKYISISDKYNLDLINPSTIKAKSKFLQFLMKFTIETIESNDETDYNNI